MNSLTSETENFSRFDELVNNLGSIFADRAAYFDQNCTFVQRNYDELKEAKFFSMAIPGDVGGGGLKYSELCSIARQMAQYCGSTALAFAMHSHPVALNCFKNKKGDEKAKATLTKIATNELIIAGTGANDWLSSNGQCERIDGGYVINAHKRFVSGSSGADVLVTSVNCQSETGSEVLHFSLPIRSEGIRVQNNWRTLGMRGTGSNDVLLENVFLPDEAIVARRPAGEWHMLWDVVLPVAMPIITSVYLGLAEKAYRYALEATRKRQVASVELGELFNKLEGAQLVVADMVRINDEYNFAPSLELSHKILSRKSIATSAIKQVVDSALTLVGGSGFFQDHPIERIVRDIRAMDFHPLPEAQQKQMLAEYLVNKQG